MFDRVIRFLVDLLPQTDAGVDPKDVLGVIRPKCEYDDLARRVMGGWGEAVMRFAKEAHDVHNAWKIDVFGNTRYETYLVNALTREFAARGLHVDDDVVRLIERNASGHCDYCTQIAAACWEYERSLTF